MPQPPANGTGILSEQRPGTDHMRASAKGMRNGPATDVERTNNRRTTEIQPNNNGNKTGIQRTPRRSTPTQRASDPHNAGALHRPLPEPVPPDAWAVTTAQRGAEWPGCSGTPPNAGVRCPDLRAGLSSAPPPGRRADIPVRSNVRCAGWLGNWLDLAADRNVRAPVVAPRCALSHSRP